MGRKGQLLIMFSSKYYEINIRRKESFQLLFTFINSKSTDGIKYLFFSLKQRMKGGGVRQLNTRTRRQFTRVSGVG